MALQIWMPLDGNLDNYGLDESGTFQGTPSFGSFGKIGEKSYFCNSATYADFSSLQGVEEYSVSYWLYVDSTQTHTGYADMWSISGSTGTGTNSVRDELRTDSDPGEHRYNMPKDPEVGSNSRLFYGITPTDPAEAKDKWSHQVLTKDANTVKLYTNGVLTKTIQCSAFEASAGHLNTRLTFGMSGCYAYLSDFRVYDNVISPLQIKLISQGLALHMPLSHDSLGIDNLVRNSTLRSDLVNWSYTADNTTITTKNGYPCVRLNVEGGDNANLYPSYAYGETTGYYIPVTGKTITVSMYVYFDNITENTSYYIAFSGGSDTIDGQTVSPEIVGTSGHTKASNSITLDPDKLNGLGWTRVWVTYYYTDEYTWSDLRPRIFARNYTGNIYVRDVKVEYSDKPTPWLPNITDNLYEVLDMGSTEEYDVSGYLHNGTRTDIEFSADTPRYMLSSVFNGNTSEVSVPATLDGIFNNPFTVSFWVKNDARTGLDTAYFGTASGNSFSIYKNDEDHLRLYWDGNPDVEVSDAGTISDDTWYMITIVKTSDSEVKVYVNGVLGGTVSAYTWDDKTFGTAWMLGRDFQIASYFFKGKMSDFRIYATALSAEDIASLYANKGYIDVNGNISAFDFSE